MGMKVTADGGSTKIHWVVTGEGGAVIKEFFSRGVNPFVVGEDVLARIFDCDVRGMLEGLPVDCVEFYGAGCRDHGSEAMRKVIRGIVGDEAGVVVESDMLGACKALLGDGAGVACILGTGANSCYYDGGEIVEKVPSLGYILGDEGSGAWIGKRLAADAVQGLLPPDLIELFFATYGIDGNEILRRVYRPEEGEDFPNRCLAGFAPFVSAHMDRPEMRRIVEDGFRIFLRRNVARYFAADGRDGITVNFVGSIASVFENVLREVAEKDGYDVGRILRSPIDGLIGR